MWAIRCRRDAGIRDSVLCSPQCSNYPDTATNGCKPLGEELLGQGVPTVSKSHPLDYLLIANEGFSLHQERSSCHFLSQAVKTVTVREPGVLWLLSSALKDMCPISPLQWSWQILNLNLLRRKATNTGTITRCKKVKYFKTDNAVGRESNIKRN